MWASLRKLDCVLSPSDIKKLLLLLIPFMAVAVLEVLGIFSIMPFMQVVADPEMTEVDSRFSWLNSIFDFSSRREMLIWIGFGILGIYAFTALCNVFTGWLITYIIWGFAHKISMNLLHRYTRQPYEYFLNHNSADMVKKAIADIHSLVSGVLMVLCRTMLNLVKSVAILTLLLFVDFKLAMLAFIVYGGVYALIHWARHRYLERLGKVRLETISIRLKSFSETLSGIKTLRVSGATKWFVDRFGAASKKFCSIQPKFQLFTLVPRSLVEFLAFGGIIMLILFQLLAGNELSSILPVLSVFAMATYKLLPALSTAFAQAAVLSHNLPVIDEVYQDMLEFQELLKPIEEFEAATPLSFNDRLTVNNISYKYDTDGGAILNNVQLEIRKGQKCAFVGTTGCGKSTLVDVMVGLLSPSQGQLQVDQVNVTMENVYGWQKKIAYVPQDVFLYDDTIAANIALGESPEQINWTRLEKAAKLACVDEFLDSTLREGYDTIVGEDGVRLSGGQRQRIGLARVFYQEPDVLFLDEATSALDSITEESIINSINQHLPDVTVIMVAHRLSSTRFCDLIFFMDAGRIIDSGPFDQLVQTSGQFKKMVEVGE